MKGFFQGLVAFAANPWTLLIAAKAPALCAAAFYLSPYWTEAPAGCYDNKHTAALPP